MEGVSGVDERLVPEAAKNDGDGSSFPEPTRARPTKPKYKTLLAIDGGGLRGIVSAMVLEEVERAIKARISKDTGAQDVEVDLADYFDCIAGTSVGSILAAYFATKGEPSRNFILQKDIQKKYGPLRPGAAAAAKIPFLERGRKIFHRPFLTGWLVPRSLKQLFAPRYSNAGLTSVLTELFGSTKLSDCHTSVVIPAFELNTSRPHSFWADADKPKPRPSEPAAPPNKRTGFSWVRVRNRFRKRSAAAAVDESSTASIPTYDTLDASGHRVVDHDKKFVSGPDYQLMEVVRASASAPTYFHASKIRSTSFAPSLSFAPGHHHGKNTSGHEKPNANDGDDEDERDIAEEQERLYVDGGMISNNPTIEGLTFACNQWQVSIEKLAVLSIGTGCTVPDLKNKAHKGILGWGSDLFGVVLDRQSEYLQSIVDNVFYVLLRGRSDMGQYTRIQLSLASHDKYADALLEMDNPKKVAKLQEIGKELAKASRRSIAEFVEKFVFAEAEEKGPKS